MSDKNSWVLGNHAVAAVLRINPERALALWVVLNPNNASQRAILEAVEPLGIAINPIDKRELNRLCGSEQHQGIALQAKAKAALQEKQLLPFVEALFARKAPLLLILDQVQDPHNFGACLRTADAAGVDAVIVAKDNASPITPVVHKVASGAAETMPVYRVTNLVRCMQSLQQAGVWMIGTSDKASSSLYQEKLTGALAIVMGAEGKGLRKLTEKSCDQLVSLPMAGSVVSSLNVSVATGICLYEVVRQRQAQAI